MRCGIGQVNAARVTEAALTRWRPRAVLVAGIGGGLQPGLRPGTPVVLDTVCAAQSRIAAASEVADAMEAALGNAGVTARRGEGWTVNGVADAAAKQKLGTDGALTVDNESFAVLDRARAHGVPAAAFRVVADPVDRGVPRSIAALAWIDGAPLWPQARDIWRLPFEVGEVARFRRDLRDGLAGLQGALSPVLAVLMA